MWINKIAENVKVSSEIVYRDDSPLNVELIRFAWHKKEEMHVNMGEKTKEEKEKTERNRT